MELAQKQYKLNYALLAGLMILSLPIIFLIFKDKLPMIGLYVAVLSAFGIIFFPRLPFFLFLLSLFVYAPTMIGIFALHPFDVFFALFLMAIIADYLLNHNIKSYRTVLDWPFILLIISAIISALFAYNKTYSINPCFRIIAIFAAYKCFMVILEKITIRKVLLFYIYMVFLHAVINLVLFVLASGKSRIFGPGWLAFETFAMTSIPMTFAFFIWSKTNAEKLKYALISIVILMALLATQSRAPLLAVVISFVILLISSYRKMDAGQKTIYRSNLLKIFIVVIFAISMMVVFKDTLFKDGFERITTLFDSFHSPKETVYLRIVLWTAAIKAFLSSPLTGIGIGNYRLVGEIIPEMRFYPVWYYISGMSAHNVLLHYLAEIGLLGTGSFIALVILNIKRAIQNYRFNQTMEQRQISSAIFIAIVVFSVTILYMRAWTWGQEGYLMAFLFALNIFHYNKTKISETV